MKMKGKLTITKPSGGRSHDQPYVSIQCEDGLSLTRFCDIEVPLLEFANALFGRGYVDMEFELRPDNVGKLRETKTEIVRTDEWHPKDYIAKKLCKPLEVDGWMADWRDMQNMHNLVKEKALVAPNKYAYRVGCWRYVENIKL